MKHIRAVIALILMMFSLTSFGQELSKRLQKEKEAFEAKIEREKKYEETLARADEAFQNDEYVEARMAYEAAIQYNAEKEQWLQSKVNDLDILMARRAARAVDSITLSAPKILATTLPARIDNKIQQRSIEGGAPEVKGVEEVDSAAILAENMKPEIVESMPVVPDTEPASPNQTVSSMDIKLTPKADPAPRPIDESTVKIDFSEFDNGVTADTFKLENSTVVRIVVKEGIDVIVYKRVKHRWGGEFFFLDDRDVTRRLWEEQVAAYRQKYPN